MANSKDYISFVLLCVFLLSSHVLTHELSKEERISTLSAMKVHGLEGSTSDSIHNGFEGTHWIGYYYPNQWGSIPHAPPGSRYSSTRPPPLWSGRGGRSAPRGGRNGPPPMNYYPNSAGFLLPFHTPLLPMHLPLMSFSGDSFGYKPLSLKDTGYYPVANYNDPSPAGSYMYDPWGNIRNHHNPPPPPTKKSPCRGSRHPHPHPRPHPVNPLHI